MNWIIQLFQGDSVAHTVLIISAVAAVGLAIGTLKIKGIGLGIAGVLFSGLAFGHFGVTISAPVLDFAREFGLILFVYTIGMQVGPGFFASLRRQGLPLNLMAAAIVLLGAGLTIAIVKVGGVPMAAAVGLFSGATTNTPSLGAAQEAIKSLAHAAPDAAIMPGLGYAVAYPFGIIGIILSMLLLRAIFRIDLKKENADLLARQVASIPKLTNLTLIVTNPNVEGVRVDQLPSIHGTGIVVSRLKHDDRVAVARPEDVIHVGDTLHAVGPAGALDEFRTAVGQVSRVDLRSLKCDVVMRRVIVTKKTILGKSLGELNLPAKHEVAVTRVTRAEVELSATPDQRLQFGDMVVLVGQPGDIDNASRELGNSVKQLNHTELIPVFIGIGLGILVGSLPIAFPGIPAPVKLGLAGGPLIVAIILSRIGRIGRLLWYMPNNANFAIREIGIVLFLSCVGLHAGEKFVATLVHGDGVKWMFMAALITVVPLMLAGLFARVFLKTNYVTICGLLAGSMTDPPALAFANAVSGSDAPSVSYATVYPLTMLLRVICAQILVLIFL